MSKILSGLLMAGLLSISAQADLLRVEMGGGVWQNELSGTITSADTSGIVTQTFDTDLLNYDKESKGYAWLYIKHPLPVIPNLRLEYTAVDFSGTSTQSFTYQGETYQTNTQSDITMDQFDIIMYYNILDNTAWITLDLGLDIKVIQSEFNAKDMSTGLEVREKETLPVPMAYARVRFELPFDIGIEGIGKYSAYKNSKVIDYLVKVDYTLTDILPIDIGLEAGYRFEKLDINGDDFDIATSGTLEIDGIFAGAVIRF
ncbi:MAG TPA: TIGR04219 family outer membrane beta-barrel protein [Sulfurimonas sp.]|nr:TIGR04219 family outer membrane beta-barrel protein [Sulfurimonas sp.]